MHPIHTISNGQQTSHRANRSHPDVRREPGGKLHAPVDDPDEQVRLEDRLRHRQQCLMCIIRRQSVHPFAHLPSQQGQLLGKHVEHRIANGVQQLADYEEQSSPNVLDGRLTARRNVKVKRRDGNASDLDRHIKTATGPN